MQTWDERHLIGLGRGEGSGTDGTDVPAAHLRNGGTADGWRGTR